jgi:hypothetical protein
VAFIVEDGSVVANANAYAAVAYVDTYHDDRGHGSWAAFDDTKKQQCIVRATDYINKRFGRRFRGIRVHRGQVLQWPRFNVFDDDGLILYNSDELPEELKQATAEYALRAGLVGELAPDPIAVVPPQDLTPDTPTTRTELTGGLIKRVSEKVDVIEETKSYQTIEDIASGGRNKGGFSSTVSDGNIPEYPAADLLLEILLTTNKRRLARG